MPVRKQITPCIFDVMVHLTIHLVEELFNCGHVYIRWMYPFGRYFKTLKGFVRNQAKAEGCIAKGYQMEEVCGFVSEYLSRIPSSFRRVWDNKEDPIMDDIVPEGKGKIRDLDDLLWRQIHSFVLDLDVIENYRL